jgi:hypothetical protein
MTPAKKFISHRLVILARRARFVTNGRGRMIEVPWLYHVVRFNGVVQVPIKPRLVDKKPLARGRVSATTRPCLER